MAAAFIEGTKDDFKHLRSYFCEQCVNTIEIIETTTSVWQ
jgi:hypothetical protein